ncbi:MAG: choice-of-anchor Q domain-containing protein [Solirubrobacterales bacterium]
MRRLEKLSKRPRTSGLLAGCLAAVALLATASAACALTYRPTRTDDPKPNGCKAKDCSLREAVIAAGARGGKIVLRPGKRYVLTRKGAGEDAGLTGDLDLTFPGIEVTTKGHGSLATIDANGIDRVFDGSPPVLNRVILRDGHARVLPGDNGNGGAVRGNPEVTDSRFINNTADGRGGAIYFAYGPSRINGSVFKGNSAASDGGAIYFFQVCAGGHEGHLAFGKSRATHNRSGGAGGAIFSYCGLDVGNSYFGDNTARGPGGGIFSPGMTVPPEATTSDPSEWGSSLEMSGSTVTGNRSGSYGGGIAFDVGSFGSTSRSTISGNAASTSGGGIGVNTPTAKPAVTVGVQNSTLANNTAGRDGGGIGSNDPTTLFGSHATVGLDHVTIARNRANTALVSGVQRAGLGGGLYEEDEDNFTVHNTLVALNTVATFHKPQASDCATPFGNPITSLGHNLVGNPVGCNGFGAAGDLFGGKLKLGKLADNGGPTKTIALLKGSRAIGRGDPDAVRGDQRGVKRDKKPDIGAYERRAKK